MKSKSFNADTVTNLNKSINEFLENDKIANVIAFSHEYNSGRDNSFNYTAILIYMPLAEHRDKQITEILG